MSTEPLPQALHRDYFAGMNYYALAQSALHAECPDPDVRLTTDVKEVTENSAHIFCELLYTATAGTFFAAKLWKLYGAPWAIAPYAYLWLCQVGEPCHCELRFTPRNQRQEGRTSWRVRHFRPPWRGAGFIMGSIKKENHHTQQEGNVAWSSSAGTQNLGGGAGCFGQAPQSVPIVWGSPGLVENSLTQGAGVLWFLASQVLFHGRALPLRRCRSSTHNVTFVRASFRRR